MYININIYQFLLTIFLVNELKNISFSKKQEKKEKRKCEYSYDAILSAVIGSMR
jgi:hypothetical protein